MITRWAAWWSRLRQFFSRGEWSARWLKLPRDSADPAGVGLVMVQIDGLGRRECELALARGEMPFLQRLMGREQYRIHSFYSGVPSSTPSVQGELFYGQRCAVPAFGFRDHRSRQLVRMFSPETARQVEERLTANGSLAEKGLLTGGSSYCNIYSGGAAESRFCAASIGWDALVRAVHPWRLALVVSLHAWSATRISALMAIEFFLAIGGFLRGARAREVWQELLMIPARVVVSVLMRELAIHGAIMDVARGLPIIHLNLLGYDEQAHRRGPHSAFAHWTLRGIDAAIRRLYYAAHHSTRRHYDVWIFSDHGQESTRSYEDVAGRTLLESVEQVTTGVLGPRAAESLDHVLPGDGVPCAAAEGGDGQSGVPRGASSSDSHRVKLPRRERPATRAQWLSPGRLVGLLFGDSAPDAQPQGPQVAAIGPVAHVYLNRVVGRDELAEIASQLVQRHAVPMACWRLEENLVAVVTPRGAYQLPRDGDALFMDHPFRTELVSDWIRLCGHADAGEIVIAGWNGVDPPLSFPRQQGGHGGPGENETHAFALLPCDAPARERGGNYLRAIDLRDAARRFLNERATKPFVSPAADESPRRPFRVMTYNVHACIGMDGQLSPQRIARVIARSGADIVALQELDAGRGRTRGEDQAHQIARALEMTYHFHPAWQILEEQYGDAILARLPLRPVKSGSLPRVGQRREPRGALWVEVQLPCGRVLQVVNTHLSVYPSERYRQAAALLEEPWIGEALRRGPVVLCGDFNAPAGAPSHELLASRLDDTVLRAETGGTQSRHTWLSSRPFIRIDHIFTSRGDFRTLCADAIDSDLARVASDHLPLVAELVLQ